MTEGASAAASRMFSAKPRDAGILTERERSLSSIKVGVVFVGRRGRVSAMYVVFYRLSLLFGWWFVFVFKSLFFRTFYADRKYQRPLRMVAFLTQNVVDVFGVSGTRLAA